ncbi:MAG: tetratricopeptide repeat protein [Myxococcota bacterium]
MAAWTRLVAASILLLASSAAAAAPTPEDTARAHALNDLGFEAAKGGRYREAARAFDEAWKLDPHPDLLWNSARAWHKAGALTQARERYRRYLTHEDLPPDQRLQASDNLVVIDRALREQAERVGRRAGAALGRVEPRWLAWTTRETRPAPLPEEPERGPSVARKVGWILVATGVVAGGAGGLFYGLAADDLDDLETFPAAVGPDESDRYDETRERFLRHRALMWTSIGVGAAALTSGVVALLLQPDEEPRTRGTAGTVSVAPLPGGASMAGTWRF